MLRAEEMDESAWWWAVYDMEENEITIDSSNEYEVRFSNGSEARMAAEQAARIGCKLISAPLCLFKIKYI